MFIHESLVYVSIRFTGWFTTGIGIVGNLDIAPSYPNELCNPLKFNSWIPLLLLALDTEPGWGYIMSLMLGLWLTVIGV